MVRAAHEDRGSIDLQNVMRPEDVLKPQRRIDAQLKLRAGGPQLGDVVTMIAPSGEELVGRIASDGFVRLTTPLMFAAAERASR